MATVNWATKASRTTGIAAYDLTGGVNVVSSEIDNSTNKDRYCDITILSTAASAPTANAVIEVYIIYSDGTNYERGSITEDPKKSPIGYVSHFADTTLTPYVLDCVPLSPRPFKILLKSELAVVSSVTVTCETYNETIA